MTTKLSDLWLLEDIGPEWEIDRPAEVSDLVEALQAEGVGEVVQKYDTFPDGTIVETHKVLVVSLGEDA